TRWLSCALPTIGIDPSRMIHGGHGARQAFARGDAVPAPLPTLQGSPRQERYRQLVGQVSGVPRHQMLAAVGEMQIQLRVAFLHKLRALLGAGWVCAAMEEDQWLFHVDEPLPQWHRRLAAAAFVGCRMPAYEFFEAAPDAVLVTQGKLLLGDQLMMEEVGFE